MARNTERDRQQREERRKQIMDAARYVFTKRGVAATKISDIAAQAGLSHGNVYNYFESKEQLLVTLVVQGQHGYSSILQEMHRQPGDSIHKLRWLLVTFLNLGQVDSNYWIVLQAQATDVLPQAMKAEITANMMANRRLLIDLVEEGQKEGTIAIWDAEELTTIFITAFHNLALWEIRGFGKPAITVVEPILKLLRP
ncbi:TetR/AcrR family transcriptional regulator [Paenibacillus sp. GSMTC-2017]|uniref:TetR/AcrR family transcriptional regulator n=1 Tax=Paenibacillus sp. GSMTC-2017 TaxID=2794350 RepID=UPI0018D7FF8A|nr:TetR/AcrR family transcriptional regulator [Paenibacillus sp. GSMTC-2017]MBH5319127.1 TetR/AcrR family transcriptional regulator [Paenibacillus sp. GSMTC-2017]